MQKESFLTLKYDASFKVQMVSSLRSGRNVNFKVLDVDWCTSDKVILASDDGCIRVLEMAMKSACFRMDEQELSGMEERSGTAHHLLIECGVIDKTISIPEMIDMEVCLVSNCQRMRERVFYLKREACFII